MTQLKTILPVLMFVWMFFVAEVGYARYAAIVIDADTGKVMHEVDSTQSWYPASLTKVMTLYMTFEALKNGQIQFFDAMRTSGHAASQPTSKLGLRAGEYLTVRDAILAIITRSANDAAVVLAEHLGGTEENFAVKMTNRAHSLGMDNTRFMNATGLPNDWQVTTSRDMALLAWKIQQHFPEYYQNFSAHSFNYKGRELRAINKFVAKYPGAEGMKTGFTCGSGFNLIAAAHQNGKRLIGVVMGGMTSLERYQLMYQMMDAGFDNRFDGGPNVHITSPSASLSGAPPYQLNCGSKAFYHPVSKNQLTSYRSVNKHKPGKSLRSGKSKRPVKVNKHAKVALKSSSIKHNSLKKSAANQNKKVSKSSRKAPIKKSSRTTTAGKHKKTIKSTKSSKPNKTRYLRSNAK